MTLNTPVALFIFNRPSLTEKVLAKIAEVQPKQLFVVADGPREDKPDDVRRCREAREAIKVEGIARSRKTIRRRTWVALGGYRAVSIGYPQKSKKPLF